MVQLNWYPQEGLVYCITKVIGGCIITMIVQAARGQNFQVAKSKFSSRVVAIGETLGQEEAWHRDPKFSSRGFGFWGLGTWENRS